MPFVALKCVGASPRKVEVVKRGQFHHVELWVPRINEATASIGWLLESLGYEPLQCWENGRSWELNGTYVVVEQSLALNSNTYDRLRPGLNHLAFHAGTVQEIDDLTKAALEHGWVLLFEEAHPYAGGPAHYASYLTNVDGFEVELVADLPGA